VVAEVGAVRLIRSLVVVSRMNMLALMGVRGRSSRNVARQMLYERTWDAR